MGLTVKGRYFCDCCGREIEYTATDKRAMINIETCGLLVKEGRDKNICEICRPHIVSYLERICKVVGDASRKEVPYDPWNKDWSDCPTTPSVKLLIEPDEINEGEKAILSWESKNAEQVTLDGNVVEPNGEMEIEPAETQTYNLFARGKDSSAMTSATITVIPLETMEVIIDTPLVEGRYMLSPTVGQIFTKLPSEPEETVKEFNIEEADSVTVRAFETVLKFAVNQGSRGELFMIDAQNLDFTTIRALLSRLGLDGESGCEVERIVAVTTNTKLEIRVDYLYNELKIYDRYIFDTVQP